jgi:hypothetical protein
MANKTQPRAENAVGDHIDITLRFNQDGGIVFQAISRIASPYARAERLRQLVYAGLLVERGISAPMQVSSAAVKTGDVSLESRVLVPDHGTAAPVANTDDASPTFATDDLMAVFGTGEN